METAIAGRYLPTANQSVLPSPRCRRSLCAWSHSVRSIRCTSQGSARYAKSVAKGWLLTDVSVPIPLLHARQHDLIWNARASLPGGTAGHSPRNTTRAEMLQRIPQPLTTNGIMANTFSGRLRWFP